MNDRVIIIGAGYAGTVAANVLADAAFHVTLINPVPYFVERVRLHRVAAGRRHARVPFEKILHEAVTLVHDEAQHIDVTNRRVVVTSGAKLTYDWLIYAVGSGSAPSHSGRRSVSCEEAATDVAESLGSQPGRKVTVVGAGLTGVETAAALAKAGHSVEVRTRDPLLSDTHHRRQYARLDRLGVIIRTGEFDGIDGDDSFVIDATGLRVPPLAATSGLPIDQDGRLLVHPSLQVPGHPEIFGAGDAVKIADEQAKHLRMSCATALPMGRHVAHTLISVSQGSTPRSFQHRYVIQCVDLGGITGRVQFVTDHDKPRPFALTSILGGLGKELVIRSTIDTVRRARGRHRMRAPSSPAKTAFVEGPS